MLVSVIMPVFNSIQFLQESIDSILYQSHMDLEFIILDDGSTEPVWDLIQSYNDSRIIAFRNSENIGLTKSLNICLDKVRGDFIVRHDSDDVSLPTRIEEQLKYFKSKVGFVTCWYDFLVQDSKKKWLVKPSSKDNQRIVTNDLLNEYTKRNCGNDAGSAYPIQVFRKIGYFDERLYLGQTYNYNRRIQKFLTGAVLPKVLYLVRRWNGRIGIQAKKLHPEYASINWANLCNQYANETPIILERENYTWKD